MNPDLDVDVSPAEGRPADGSSTPRSEADDDAAETALPMDLVFELLQVRRRRLVLRYLRSNGGDARLGDLAEHIAAIENDVDERAISSSQRKRVYIALYQCHLPKLDDAGVVDYGQARGTIELRPRADRLFRYLDRVDRRADDGVLTAITRYFGRLRR